MTWRTRPLLCGTSLTALAQNAHALSGGSWDLVIADIGLPDGSGYDVARITRIAEQLSATPG